MGWGVCVGGWGGASAAEARAGKAGQSHTPRGRSRGSGSCGGANPKHPKPKHQAPSHTPRGRTLVLERHGGDAHVLWCHQVIVVDADHQRLLHLRQCVCGSVRGWLGGGGRVHLHPPTRPPSHAPTTHPLSTPRAHTPTPSATHTHVRARALPRTGSSRIRSKSSSQVGLSLFALVVERSGLERGCVRGGFKCVCLGGRGEGRRANGKAPPPRPALPTPAPASQHAPRARPHTHPPPLSPLSAA